MIDCDTQREFGGEGNTNPQVDKLARAAQGD